MSKGPGYLLPANLEPEDDRCFVVYVPAEQKYIDAFIGSLVGLEKWTIWERTGDNSGAIAARRWKQANQRTLDAMAIVDCDLLNEMLEDGDMSIVINNNTSCGGCGSCGECASPTSTYTPLPTQPQPDTLPTIENIPDFEDDGATVPPGFDDYDSWLNYKCSVARTIAFNTYDTLVNMSTLSGLAGLGAATLAAYVSSASVVGGLVTGLLGVGLLATGAMWFIIASLVAMVLAGTALLFYISALSDRVLANIDVLTCIIFQGPTKEAVKANVTSFFQSEVAAIAYDNTVEEGVFTVNILRIIDYLLPTDLFGILNQTVEELEEQIRADDGFNCIVCGELGVLGAWAITSTTGSNDPDVTLHSVGQEAWQLSGTMNRGPINFEQLYMATVGNAGFDFDVVFAVSIRGAVPVTPAPTANQGVRWHDNGPNIEVAFQAGESILFYLTGARPAAIPPFENEIAVATHDLLAPVMRLEWPGGASPFEVGGAMADLVLYDVNGDPIVV